MPASIEIDASELDRLDGQLEKMQRQVDGTLKKAMGQSMELLRADLAKYPPESAANRSPGVNGYSWYERGFGTHTVTGLSYPTSEELGRSWNKKVKGSFFGGSVTGTLRAGASYGGYVHDPEMQASFHAARGWPTTEEVAEKNESKVQGIFNRAIAGLLRRVGLK